MSTHAKTHPITHPITIADIECALPIINVGPVSVALLNLLGDSELTEACAEALVQRLPAEASILITPEAKAIPLAHAMSVKSQLPYVVARKTKKPYMVDAVTKTALSITTGKPQDLVLDGSDVARLKGKQVVIIDDVVSTGGTLQALSELLADIGAHSCATMAVLTEGDSREDVIALGHLPLYPADLGV